MKRVMWRGATLIVVLALISEGSVQNFDDEYTNSPRAVYENPPEIGHYVATGFDEEYIRHIYSMYDAYRGDSGGRMVVETDALVDTKYRTWKRNADLINSLLALPKGMNDAGR